MSSPTSDFIQLAKRILACAESIDSAFHESNEALPSFSNDHSPTWPAKCTEARFELLQATEKLQQLAADPLEMIMEKIQPEITVPNIILDFQIAQSVPVNDDKDGRSEASISYPDLSQKTGLPERELRRVLKFAFSDCIFRETEEGKVAHTPSSRLLATNPGLRDWADVAYREVLPAKLSTVPALKKYGASDKPGESGFALSNKSNLSLFDYLKSNPDRSRVFGGGMRAVHSRQGFELSHLVENLPGQENQLENCVVVDVGGSHGHASIAIAQAFPGARCVVQDLPSVLERPPPVPEELGDRVKFLIHDFFTEQLVPAAGIYLVRNVLHNWGDADCKRIIGRLAEVMVEESYLVINDWCLADTRDYHSLVEKKKRRMDINMLCLQNARERDLADWQRLIQDVDMGLEISSVVHPPASNYSLVIVQKRK